MFATIGSEAQEGLAKSIASLCPATPEALKNEFEILNSSAEEQAKLVVPAATALNDACGDLVLILTKMQSLLSQRGENRELFADSGMPTWSQWWESYQKKTGLGISFRTVQRKLKNVRSLGKPAEELGKRPDPPLHLSSRDQRRVLKALQCANEMVDALNHGADHRPALDDYNRIALDRDSIDQMLEATIPPVVEVALMSSTSTAPAPAAPDVAEIPGVLPSRTPQPSPLRMPKGGDHSTLFDVVNDRCAGEIHSCLADLPPDLMAMAIGSLVRKLTNMYCHYDREAGEIVVNVEYVSLKPSAFEAAA
jgi:hypothetical protein